MTENLDWDKGDGLLPAIVQDADSGRVLMLAYMNRDALARSLDSGRVTFWSRSRQVLWTKGESSGNHLALESVSQDCDGDTLLVLARPTGPACHRGTRTCFDAPPDSPAETGDDEAPGADPAPAPPLAFMADLERLIAQRDRERPAGSYTTRLLESGVARMAQKVGEEGVETALAAATGDDIGLQEEAADLLYHLLVLLRSRGLGLRELAQALAARHG